MRRPSAPALVVLALFLAACSSDGSGGSSGGTPSGSTQAEGVAPGEYIEGLCAAIVSYQEDLDSENASFQEQFSGGTPSPAETKQALVAFLTEAADRTRKLKADVEALGTPEVDNGEQIKAAFVSAFQQVVALFAGAKEDIENLSADDPAALAEGFTSAASKLQEAGAGIGASLDNLSSDELGTAATDAPSCKGVI